jgi:hypothetical protein
MGKPEFNPVRDLVSGAIMAATSVPQLIAYAETVGYAGYRGLTTAGPTLMAWGFSTGGPFMNSGVTSITALMAKSDLNGEAYLAEHGEEAYVELVAAYSLYVGIASIFLALVGFGKLASYVPKSVRTGASVQCRDRKDRRFFLPRNPKSRRFVSILEGPYWKDYFFRKRRNFDSLQIFLFPKELGPDHFFFSLCV